MSESDGQRLPKNLDLKIGKTTIEDHPEHDLPEEPPMGRKVKPKALYQVDAPVNDLVRSYDITDHTTAHENSDSETQQHVDEHSVKSEQVDDTTAHDEEVY